MIVHNLNVPCIVIGPSEANAPLIIDSNAHPAGTITCEGLQSISRRVSQVLQSRRGIQLTQFAQGPILNVARKLPARPAQPNTPRIYRPK